MKGRKNQLQYLSTQSQILFAMICVYLDVCLPVEHWKLCWQWTWRDLGMFEIKSKKNMLWSADFGEKVLHWDRMVRRTSALNLNTRLDAIMSLRGDFKGYKYSLVLGVIWGRRLSFFGIQKYKIEIPCSVPLSSLKVKTVKNMITLFWVFRCYHISIEGLLCSQWVSNYT